MARQSFREFLGEKISRRAALRNISLCGLSLPLVQMVSDSKLHAQSLDPKPAGTIVSKPVFTVAERNRRWEAVRRS